jgi:ABC-type antimicrobial peptide transport system permease subunit
MALGACTRTVVGGVLQRTLVIAAGGVLLGAAGAVVVTRALRTYLFQVMPTDPVTFMAGASVLVAVALLAGWLPARRAARIDPAQVLRAE